MLEGSSERNRMATMTCPLCGLTWWTPATQPGAHDSRCEPPTQQALHACTLP